MTAEELRAAGLSTKQVEWRVHKGLLIPEHRGVYRVGHTAASTDALYLAAVKACGTGALLAGRAGAFHWRILRGRPPQPEVATPTKRERAGIRTKRRRMERAEATRYMGIPILTIGAILVDIARDLTDGDLARACHEASVKHRTLHSHVNAVLERRPRSPGAPKLRAIMYGETKVSLSVLEREFLRLLAEANLPLPEMNRTAGTMRVDCRWPEHRLTIELDSYRFHNSRYSWEQDRERERQARGREDEFHRFTWSDVTERPAYLVSEMRRLLGVDAEKAG
ncbi:MAG: hypothetical protein QOE06_1751 [Thermoleophilaceae bacterium]|nr:hypothetical protein [Thermoleophilaceae bacterium]